MPRRGPLLELPLELFLPANPNLPNRTTSHKRPLSPGGPSLFSPAKRRILNEEGIFSPAKSVKSPLPARGTPAARFSQVLTGPCSPAKRLDFGSPKHLSASPAAPRQLPADATPQRTLASSSRLAPSPELKPGAPSSSNQSSEDREIDDYFSQPSSSFLIPPPSSYSSVVTRESPPPPDPQSIHYPGFPVYFDKHISVSPVEETSQPSDKDEAKENILPRRKPRKAVSNPQADLKFQLLSPHSKKREAERPGKAKSTPATPRKVLSGDRPAEADSPTPRRFAAGLLREETSSSRLTEQERKERRRLLHDEADDGESSL
ncbi:hypothetical protein LshimejAT787_0108880 [Lyophyllum shimeji]|uniref:Uncharacterized protein n=1 Tax=Lyophyllum shimeji TaxID=47721 RepID=A0A9P3PEH0_LYOSH|nr:hypothetical protein LshimejAT787_0108880 [Lyophyllum shimeji]